MEQVWVSVSSICSLKAGNPRADSILENLFSVSFATGR